MEKCKYSNCNWLQFYQNQFLSYISLKICFANLSIYQNDKRIRVKRKIVKYRPEVGKYLTLALKKIFS